MVVAKPCVVVVAKPCVVVVAKPCVVVVAKPCVVVVARSEDTGVVTDLANVVVVEATVVGGGAIDVRPNGRERLGPTAGPLCVA